VKGVPNSRKDLAIVKYESGMQGAIGEVGDRIKTIETDENVDGKFDLRQTYAYDAAGQHTAIDERGLELSTYKAKYTFEYNARGLTVLRKFDDKSDGTVDATAEWKYDAFGVLTGVVSTGSQAFTLSPQYICE
jgi:hypothetical protein